MAKMRISAAVKKVATDKPYWKDVEVLLDKVNDAVGSKAYKLAKQVNVNKYELFSMMMDDLANEMKAIAKASLL